MENVKKCLQIVFVNECWIFFSKNTVLNRTQTRTLKNVSPPGVDVITARGRSAATMSALCCYFFLGTANLDLLL